jgi:hypothetical protein
MCITPLICPNREKAVVSLELVVDKNVGSAPISPNYHVGAANASD